jgi:hypothetical protein
VLTVWKWGRPAKPPISIVLKAFRERKKNKDMLGEQKFEFQA